MYGETFLGLHTAQTQQAWYAIIYDKRDLILI